MYLKMVIFYDMTETQHNKWHSYYQPHHETASAVVLCLHLGLFYSLIKIIIPILRIYSLFLCTGLQRCVHWIEQCVIGYPCMSFATFVFNPFFKRVILYLQCVQSKHPHVYPNKLQADVNSRNSLI